MKEISQNLHPYVLNTERILSEGGPSEKILTK